MCVMGVPYNARVRYIYVLILIKGKQAIINQTKYYVYYSTRYSTAFLYYSVPDSYRVRTIVQIPLLPSACIVRRVCACVREFEQSVV